MPSVRTRCRNATRSTSRSRPVGSLSACANWRESNGSSSKKAEMTSCVSLMGSLSRLAAGLPHREGSSCGDWSCKLLTQLHASAVDAGPDGVRSQSARISDFFVAKACHLTHEEYVTIEVWQCGERLVDGEV